MTASPAVAANTTGPATAPSAATAAATGASTALVMTEKQRLATIRGAEPSHASTTGQPVQPYRVDFDGRSTLVLPARTAAYTLDAVRAADPQSLSVDKDGDELLQESLVVDQGATLRVSGPRATTLRLSSGPTGFTSIVAYGGRLELVGTGTAPLVVESWDPQRHAVDTDLDDGRAYLLAIGSLLVQNTTVHDLGFAPGHTGGLALLDVAGENLPTRSTTARHRRTPGASTTTTRTPAPATATAAGGSTGSVAVRSAASEVSGARIDGGVDGLFVSGTTGTTVSDTTIGTSSSSGLVLDDVRAARVTGVHVAASGRDGISLRRATGAVLSDVDVTKADRYGINLDQSVEADDTTGPTRYGQDSIDRATVSGSRQAGVQITGGTQTSLTDSSITTPAEGVVVTGDASSVVVRHDTVQGASQQGVVVRSANDVQLTGSTVHGASSAIAVTDARAQVTQNTVIVGQGHAVVLTGDVTGSTVSGNRLQGTGALPIDSAGHQGTPPTLSGNDLSGWTVPHADHGLAAVLLRPTTLVWLLIAVLIVGTWPFYRTLRAIRSPYDPTSPEAAVTAGIRSDQEAAIRAALASGRPLGAVSATSLPPVDVALPDGISPARPRGSDSHPASPSPYRRTRLTAYPLALETSTVAAPDAAAGTEAHPHPSAVRTGHGSGPMPPVPELWPTRRERRRHGGGA